VNRLKEGKEIFFELFGIKRSFSNGGVNDPGLFNTVLEFTSFQFSNNLGYVHGDGTNLGVGHQVARSKNSTELTDKSHHVGCCDGGIKINPASFDLGDQIFGAYEVCSSCLGFLGFCTSGENDHAGSFT